MPALYFGRSSRANVITELLSTSLPRTSITLIVRMCEPNRKHSELECNRLVSPINLG